MIKQKIDIGQEIRDSVFEGNNYAQLGYLMEGLKALKILINANSTEEEINWANEKINELEVIEEKILAIKEKYE